MARVAHAVTAEIPASPWLELVKVVIGEQARRSSVVVAVAAAVAAAARLSVWILYSEDLVDCDQGQALHLVAGFQMDGRAV